MGPPDNATFARISKRATDDGFFVSRNHGSVSIPVSGQSDCTISAKGTQFLKARPSELPLKTHDTDAPIVDLIQETDDNFKQKQAFKKSGSKKVYSHLK